MDQKRDGQRQHDQHLRAAEQRGRPHRELHSVVREKPDHDKRCDGEYPPRDSNAKSALQRVRKKIAKEPAGSRRTKNVVDQVTPRRDESCAIAEPAGGERIISTTRRHEFRKLRNRIRDQQADDRRQKKRNRHRRAGFERDDRKGKDNIRRGSDMRDAMKN